MPYIVKRAVTKIFVRQESFFFSLVGIFLTRPQSFFHFNLMNVSFLFNLFSCPMPNVQYFSQLNYRIVPQRQFNLKILNFTLILHRTTRYFVRVEIY